MVGGCIMLMEKLLDSITSEMFSNLDIEKTLADRDCDPFSSNLIKTYKEIEKLKIEKGYSDEQIEENDVYRKRMFFKACDVHTYNELMGYISDDFGLIYDSIQLDYKSPWLEKLIACYLEKRVPCGDL